jgi:hypothetical protein
VSGGRRGSGGEYLGEVILMSLSLLSLEDDSEREEEGLEEGISLSDHECGVFL